MAKTYSCGKCKRRHGINNKIGKLHKKFKVQDPKRVKKPMSVNWMKLRIERFIEKKYNIVVYSSTNSEVFGNKLVIVRPYHRVAIHFASYMEDFKDGKYNGTYTITIIRSDRTKKNDPYDFVDLYYYNDVLSKKKFSTINDTAETVSRYIMKYISSTK